jgi:hypothetical protein
MIKSGHYVIVLPRFYYGLLLVSFRFRRGGMNVNMCPPTDSTPVGGVHRLDSEYASRWCYLPQPMQ